MLHINDKIKTDYGIGTVIGILHNNYIIQFYDVEALPEFILENKHGKGYWWIVPIETNLDISIERKK